MNSYIFVNSDEIYKFKAKDSKTNAAPSCLGNVVKNYSADNMKLVENMGLYLIFQLIMIVLMLIIFCIYKYSMKKHDTK